MVHRLRLDDARLFQRFPVGFRALSPLGLGLFVVFVVLWGAVSVGWSYNHLGGTQRGRPYGRAGLCLIGPPQNRMKTGVEVS